MTREKSYSCFALKLAIFNAIGFGTTTLGLTYRDAHLASDTVYGPRHYWMGYGVGIGIPIVGVLLYLGLTRYRGRSRLVTYVVPAIPLMLSIPLLWNFRPQFPDMNLLAWTSFYCAATAISVWVHLAPLPDWYLSKKGLSDEIKMERVKHVVEFWRGLSYGFSFAYMALLLGWCNAPWDGASRYITSPREVKLVMTTHGIFLLILTIFVVCVPVHEMIQKTWLAGDLLLQIRSDGADISRAGKHSLSKG